MKVRVAKGLVFAAALIPFALMLRGLFTGSLGVNPVETITHGTGDWALRFLLLSLAITPARKLLGIPELIRFRRMLGLFSFFYAGLHVLIWAYLDKMFDPSAMLEDVQKRPYIAAGTVAFICLVPLAVTSTSGWIRRLGGKRWQALHRLSYLAAAAAVIHFLWLVKSDIREPGLYALALVALMAARLWLRFRTALRSRGPGVESVAG